MNDTHDEEIVTVGEEAAKVQPKRVPSKHRHLKAAESIDISVVEMVLGAIRADSADELKRRILQRMGYPVGYLERIQRRVARFKANREGHRMPSHIKAMDATIALIDACVIEFNKPKPAPESIVAKVVKGAKNLAKDFASEVKAQQV